MLREKETTHGKMKNLKSRGVLPPEVDLPRLRITVPTNEDPCWMLGYKVSWHQTQLPLVPAKWQFGSCNLYKVPKLACKNTRRLLKGYTVEAGHFLLSIWWKFGPTHRSKGSIKPLTAISSPDRPNKQTQPDRLSFPSCQLLLCYAACTVRPG